MPRRWPRFRRPEIEARQLQKIGNCVERVLQAYYVGLGNRLISS